MAIQGKIAQIIDNQHVVLNIGAEHGVTPGQKFVIYQPGQEIFDPDTRASLGRLELVKGRIVIEHVQDKLSFGITEIKNQDKKPKILSELMVEASVAKDAVRERLSVRKCDTNPLPSLEPVQVGDWVRSE